MMKSLGGTVMDPADVPSAVDGSLWKCADTSRSLVVAADCREYLGRYLQALGGEGGCRSVEDIIACVASKPRSASADFGSSFVFDLLGLQQL